MNFQVLHGVECIGVFFIKVEIQKKEFLLLICRCLWSVDREGLLIEG